ncbi:hypothetical protein [Deinococcus cellulosilyticus]|uniref:Uncharacterized protein n=1 Tax=Deinococcus cellulosilyticus (strain DSM 18568 / NBRC 106333 / KACC 11606 / 5516J-15) TaxID=1223518 RepID=A0A511N1H0_DEIC1|nr:hypothetical protein [Deinococcus cellulosilyticus]GEM46337.1 hypothetical protein DC3_19720 [Deinococcus cellulosilyticus NBRC 106333 = KACC 11606]
MAQFVLVQLSDGSTAHLNIDQVRMVCVRHTGSAYVATLHFADGTRQDCGKFDTTEAGDLWASSMLGTRTNGHA